MRRLSWTAAIIFALDQLSKWIVVHLMDLKTLAVIEVLPPYLTFHMAWNRGVNFGLFGSGSDITRWFLIALALAISAWVVWWVRQDGGGKIVEISAGFLVGGALGNVIDRVLYGAVADFLNMSCCGVENPFSFNVADIAIFIGAFGLMIFAGRGKSA
ncbi:MAG: signal peptidase II [Rhodobacteraceae bacterium]|nr:signal peptidase II [Paracoccaceae bacterium]